MSHLSEATSESIATENYTEAWCPKHGSYACGEPCPNEAPTVSPSKTSADANRKIRTQMRIAAVAWLNEREDDVGSDQVKTLTSMLVRAWDDGFEAALALPEPEPKRSP